VEVANIPGKIRPAWVRCKGGAYRAISLMYGLSAGASMPLVLGKGLALCITSTPGESVPVPEGAAGASVLALRFLADLGSTGTAVAVDISNWVYCSEGRGLKCLLPERHGLGKICLGKIPLLRVRWGEI